MSAQSVLDAIRRVEEAPLADLVRVSEDDVQAQMDHLLEPGIDSASLYRRWEKQQWAVSDLDFAVDVQHWENLPATTRQVMQNTMTLFFIGEQAVTDTLAPLLYATPNEDERIFLATQIADEARHTVFFQRFFEEVLGVGGGLHAALEAIGPRTSEGFRKIFDHQLIEGYLALTGQRTLLRTLRNVGMMPGFVAGFTAVSRDESRHIGFGVLALRRRIAKQPEMARVVTLKVLELLEPAVKTAVAPDRKLPIEDPRPVPPPLRINSVEVREFALSSLAKRLRAAGVSEAATEEIRLQGMALYDAAWSDYERNHGVRHPVRFYQEGLVTAP